MDLENIKKEIEVFVKERDWEKFHSPKNIAIALSVEASELLEIFQWLEDKDSHDETFKDAIKDEVSDVFYYLVRICQLLEIDLEDAFIEKMKKNKLKHPIDKVKGKAV